MVYGGNEINTFEGFLEEKKMMKLEYSESPRVPSVLRQEEINGFKYGCTWEGFIDMGHLRFLS